MLLRAAVIVSCLAAIAFAESVDIHRFGFIKPGMDQGEVLRRLGQPDQVRHDGLIANTQRYSSGRRETTVRPKATWCWVGDSQTKTKCVQFDGDTVLKAY